MLVLVFTVYEKIKECYKNRMLVLVFTVYEKIKECYKK